MVDRHDAQRRPAESLLPGHPVRNRPHLDRGQHRIAERATLDERAAAAHGMVVAHVLIHHQPHARPLAGRHDFLGLGEACGQRLLRHNAANLAGPLQGFSDHRWLHIGGHCNVEHPDGRIVEQLAEVAVGPWDPMPGSHGTGRSSGATGDRHGVETVGPIGGQMAVGHDEAGADAADPRAGVAGKRRKVVEVGECSRHKLSARCGRSISAALKNPGAIIQHGLFWSTQLARIFSTLKSRHGVVISDGTIRAPTLLSI